MPGAWESILLSVVHDAIFIVVSGRGGGEGGNTLGAQLRWVGAADARAGWFGGRGALPTPFSPCPLRAHPLTVLAPPQNLPPPGNCRALAPLAFRLALHGALLEFPSERQMVLSLQ